MIYKILSIRDRAADAFAVPMFFQSTGQAIRAFADEIKNPRENNNLNKHPDDFDLYLIGEFDDQTGLFKSDRPSQVAVGKDFAV